MRYNKTMERSSRYVRYWSEGTHKIKRKAEQEACDQTIRDLENLFFD